MKTILNFEDLPPQLQETLTDPVFSVSISNFCNKHSVSDKALRTFIESKITDLAFGSLSIDSCISEISKVLEIEINDENNDIFTLILDLYNDENIAEILKYDVNQNSLETRSLFDIDQDRNYIPEKQTPTVELARNPEVVQSKLLQTLESFNLHVDEKGIVAHEVERYLKGEILSRDLVPHLTAMLDKPLSEINAIVSALNTQIFKPIQKQIAEEGTLDISYDDDLGLKNFLIQKKGFGSSSPVTQKGKKVDIKKISFLPKEVLKTISQQKKDELVIDLRSQGGTPSGASLLSQEIQKEQKESFISKALQQPQETISKKYAIDPYREIPE